MHAAPCGPHTESAALREKRCAKLSCTVAVYGGGAALLISRSFAPQSREALDEAFGCAVGTHPPRRSASRGLRSVGRPSSSSRIAKAPRMPPQPPPFLRGTLEPCPDGRNFQKPDGLVRRSLALRSGRTIDHVGHRDDLVDRQASTPSVISDQLPGCWPRRCTRSQGHRRLHRGRPAARSRRMSSDIFLASRGRAWGSSFQFLAGLPGDFDAGLRPGLHFVLPRLSRIRNLPPVSPADPLMRRRTSASPYGASGVGLVFAVGALAGTASRSLAASVAVRSACSRSDSSSATVPSSPSAR